MTKARKRIAKLGKLIAQGRTRVLSVRDVETFLGKSKRSFSDLREDEAEGFPAPFVMRGRDYWLSTDIAEWIESRRRKDSVPGRSALASEAA